MKVIGYKVNKLEVLFSWLDSQDIRQIERHWTYRLTRSRRQCLFGFHFELIGRCVDIGKANLQTP